MEELKVEESLKPEFLSVSDVTRIIKGLIEGADALQAVAVKGEAFDVKLYPSSHLYFGIKDESAQIKCAFFGYGKRFPKPQFQNGDEIIVFGRVGVYEKSGEYRLYAINIMKEGIGLLAAKFEELKSRLYSEGLFAEEHKIHLPAFPKTIAVVTSEVGAALQDILNVFRRRAPYLTVKIIPCMVQGDQAPPTIIRALRFAESLSEVDLIILARGGGSMEDLWCFNDESLARAIFDMKRPVVSGIGHEVDFTIADYVADLRAPTPTAAAELSTPNFEEVAESFSDLADRFAHSVGRWVEDAEERVDRVSIERMAAGVLSRINNQSFRIESYILLSVCEKIARRISASEARMKMAEELLGSLSPIAVLKRGFSYVQDRVTSRLISKLADVEIDQKIAVTLQDGRFGGKVDEKPL